MAKQDIIESIRKKFKRKRGRQSEETKAKMSDSHKQRIIEIKNKEASEEMKASLTDYSSHDLIGELSDYYGINK